MPFFLIIALVIAIVAVIFALQNSIPVTVVFLVWRFEGSLALVLLLTLAIGVILGLSVSMPSIIRRGRTIAAQQKKIVELEAKKGAASIVPDRDSGKRIL